MSAPFYYTCSCCGESHEGLSDLAFDAPFHYHALSDEDRRQADLTSDLCIIEDDRFVRGRLVIPVHGREEPFTYGVWVSLSQDHFRRYVELFDATDRIPPEPWFGWLCNEIPGYPDTLNLQTDVLLQSHPKRPLIEIQAVDHPLAVNQRSGISLARLQAILEANAHSA